MGDKVLNMNYIIDVICYVCVIFFFNILFINYLLWFEKYRNFCLNVNRGIFFFFEEFYLWSFLN